MGGAAQTVTVVAGLPIPSTSPLFLTIVAIHVLLGIVSVAAGATAMLSVKAPGRHPAFGTLYFWGLTGVFATASALSAMRWDEDRVLFGLGAMALASALAGRTAMRWGGWPRLHLAAMGSSYILLLTAFYVDNGKNLPVWKALPSLVSWLAPAGIGAPLILWALMRHPLVRRLDRRA